MELYVYENYKKRYPFAQGKALTDILIKETYEKRGIKVENILRTEKGKPYIPGSDGKDRFFSVSHSGSCFVCLVSSIPVGVDIQQYRKAETERISRRYFTEDECRVIEAKGEDGFFFIWTRKEAYSKYTGLGLEQIMKGTSVLSGEDVEFFDFKLEKGMYCSCCIMKQTEEKDTRQLSVFRY